MAYGEAGRRNNRVEYGNLLADALEKVKKEQGGIDLIEHAVRQAYNNPVILQSILKKVLPDLTVQDINSKEIILQLVQYGQNGNSQISVIPQKNGIENKPLYIGNQQSKEPGKPITDFKFEVLDVKKIESEEKQEESKESIKEEPKTLKD